MTKKVLVIFDSGLAGAGGKSNPLAPLAGKMGMIGSGEMLAPYLAKKGWEISATLYCGMETYRQDRKQVVEKLVAMVEKIKPDFVLCGPAFDFKDYGQMCCEVTDLLTQRGSVKAVAMMAAELKDLISDYKDRIPILKMPKKGGVGLGDSFSRMACYLDLVAQGQSLSDACY